MLELSLISFFIFLVVYTHDPKDIVIIHSSKKEKKRH
jgi:hypothetical protein